MRLEQLSHSFLVELVNLVNVNMDEWIMDRQVSVNDRLQAASCGDAAHIQTAMQVWESAEGVPKWAR